MAYEIEGDDKRIKEGLKGLVKYSYITKPEQFDKTPKSFDIIKYCFYQISGVNDIQNTNAIFNLVMRMKV